MKYFFGSYMILDAEEYTGGHSGTLANSLKVDNKKYGEKNMKKGLISIVLGLSLGCSLVVLFCFGFFINSGQAAQPDSGGGKVIIVTVDRIALKDLNWAKLPNLKEIYDRGAMGIMNTATGSGNDPGSTYFTIGAGTRAVGSNPARLAFNRSEKIGSTGAQDLWQRRNGSGKPTGQILNPFVSQINLLNKNEDYTIPAGALAEGLHAKGIKLACVGNADTPNELGVKDPNSTYNRQIAAIVMNQNGQVDFGDVSGDNLMKDDASPYGVRTNQNKLLANMKKALLQAGVVAVEFGDTSRADDYSTNVSPALAARQKETALQNADQFLGQVLHSIDLNNDLLIVTSPTPARVEAHSGNNMTPVLMVGKGISHGLLTSGTTHRRGILANIDLTATVLQFFQAQYPFGVVGQPISVVSNANPDSYLLNLNKELVSNSLRRLLTLESFAYFNVFALILSLVMFTYYILNKKVPKWLQLIHRISFSLILSWPIAIFLLAAFGPLTIIASLIYLIGLNVLISLVIFFLSRNSYLLQIIIPAFLAVLLLLADIILNHSGLIMNSPLGYDPQIGARFYGIGNEFMGVVVGGSIMGYTALLDYCSKCKRWLHLAGVIFFLGIIFVLTYPGLGAKAGAAIVTVVSFGVLFLGLKGYRLGWKQVGLIALAVLALLFVLVSVDIMRGGAVQSHMGRAGELILHGGWIQAVLIIERKLAMELRLMRVSYWTWVLISSLAILLLMFNMKAKFLEPIRERFPATYTGCFAAIVGSLVAFAFNDAGIVAASTASIYSMSTLIRLGLADFNGER